MKIIFFLPSIKKLISLIYLNFLRIILIFCLVILSSCQNQTQKESGVIHLTLWQGINPPVNREVFQKLVGKFNSAHPEIQVESIFAGTFEQQLPKILSSVIGNAPPDILVFHPQITGKLLNLEAIRPLDDWLEKLSVKSEVFPNLLDRLRLKGQTWSIPYSTSNIAIFYRPTLFEAAGITQPPQTWEELRADAKKLTIDRNGDHRPEQHGILLPLGKGDWTVFTWLPFLLSTGGDIVRSNYPNLTSPGAIAALQFWQDLLKDGTATLSAPERGYEEDAFIAGRVAMQITGPWTYITRSKVDFKTMPIPMDKVPATVTGTGVMFVMKTNPTREEAALKFLEYVLSAEFQTEWSLGTGFLPINIKAVESPAYQQYLHQKPWLKTFVDQMSVAQSRPIMNGYSRLSDSLGRAIESTLLGKSAPETALKEAQKRLDLIWNERKM